MRSFSTCVSGVALLAGLVSCAGEQDAGPPLTHPCVSWCDTIAPWPHDGNPYEGENYTVYSDGASLDARIQLAEVAEEVMIDARTLLELPGNDLLTLPQGQAKIHLYAYRYQFPQEWGGQAWLSGFLVWSLDHPQRTALGHTELGFYSRMVKHELLHVFQNLLVGSSHSYSTHTWFEEGWAEFVSELNPEHRIESLGAFNERIAEFGQLNPISIHNDVYPDIDEVGLRYFYPMFELTLRYLFDENGLDKSPLDVKAVFLDMGDGASFVDAFEDNFGLSVTTLEAEYFDRMRAYLAATPPNRSKTARLKAMLSSYREASLDDPSRSE